MRNTYPAISFPESKGITEEEWTQLSRDRHGLMQWAADQDVRLAQLERDVALLYFWCFALTGVVAVLAGFLARSMF